MKNLFALVGLLVVGFGGVGWYMNWYTLKINRTTSGDLQVQTNVNTKQVADDAGNWLQQAGKFLDTKVQKASDDAKVPTPGPGGTTPGPMTIPNPNPNPNSTSTQTPAQGNWLMPPQTYTLNPPK